MYLCGVNWNIIHLDETDSTNCLLKEHGEGDMVVWADYQTAGRGCGTNTWESERGKNLLFSVLLHPQNLHASHQFLISAMVSVALCEILEKRLNGQRVEIKWPNDIYVNGRKIAGILIENTLQGNTVKNSIVGVGLNVNQKDFKGDAPNPVSLFHLTGQETNRETLLHECLHSLKVSLKEENIFLSFKERCFLKGKEAVYEDSYGRFKATITNVEPDGRLVMTDEDGQERRYAFKEVKFIL